MTEARTAIYLAGHGSKSKPRFIELQYQRILRYREAFLHQYGAVRQPGVDSLICDSRPVQSHFCTPFPVTGKVFDWSGLTLIHLVGQGEHHLTVRTSPRGFESALWGVFRSHPGYAATFRTHFRIQLRVPHSIARDISPHACTDEFAGTRYNKTRTIRVPDAETWTRPNKGPRT
jgi:hypothetical protein